MAKPIERAFGRINKQLAREKFNEIRHLGFPTSEIREKVREQMKKPVSLRSTVKAPEGYMLLDMDFRTAEVVALGYSSGDETMIKVLTEPDTQFARIDPGNPKKAVRIAYNENEGIPDAEHDPALLVSIDDPRILRNEDGSIKHPKRDLHWEFATALGGKPREKLDERVYRDGVVNVGNFSIPYGAAATLLERMLAVNAGSKPPEGTGDKMIESYKTRYPAANRFLEHMEHIVVDPGMYRSISGRVRHLFYNNLADVEGLSEYSRSGILSPLTRRFRVFSTKAGLVL